jgi:hypothetical protein
MKPAREVADQWSTYVDDAGVVDLICMVRDSLLEELMDSSEVCGNVTCVPIEVIEKLWKENKP